MKYLILILLVISANVNASERYMKNTVGGYITLTDGKCNVSYLKEDYPRKVYFTNADNQYREGCFTVVKTKTEFDVIIIEDMGSPQEDNISIYDFRKFKTEKK